MFKTDKQSNEITEQFLIANTEAMLKELYTNKSSTEYKSHGDITLHHLCKNCRLQQKLRQAVSELSFSLKQISDYNTAYKLVSHAGI